MAVYANTIEDYVNDEFYSALQAWHLTKCWGLANSGGWADQPWEYIEAISALENEHNAMEAEEMEKVSSKGKMKNAKNVGAGKVSNIMEK